MAACIAGHNTVPGYDVEEESKVQTPSKTTQILEERSGLYSGKITRLGDLIRQVEIVDDEWDDIDFPTSGFLVTEPDEEEGFDFEADSVVNSTEPREELPVQRSVSDSQPVGFKKELTFEAIPLRLEEPIPTLDYKTARAANNDSERRSKPGTSGSIMDVEPSPMLLSPAFNLCSRAETQSPNWDEDGEMVEGAFTGQNLNFESTVTVPKIGDFYEIDDGAPPTEARREKVDDSFGLADIELTVEQHFPQLNMPVSPPSVSNSVSNRQSQIDIPDALPISAPASPTTCKMFRRVAWQEGEDELKDCNPNDHFRSESCPDSKVSVGTPFASFSNKNDQIIETMDDDFDFGPTEPINFQLQLAPRFFNDKQPTPRVEPENSLDDWSEPPFSLNTNSSQEHSSPASSYTARSRRGSCPSPTLGSSAVSVIMSDDEDETFDEIIIPEEMSTLKLAIRKCDGDPNASHASDSSIISHMDMTKENIGHATASEKGDSDDEDILSGLEVSEGSFFQAKNPHVVSRIPGLVSTPPHRLRRESILFSSIAAASAFASPQTSPIPHSRIPRLLGGSLLLRNPEDYESQPIAKSPRSPIHSRTASPSNSSEIGSAPAAPRSASAQLRWGNVSPSNTEKSYEMTAQKQKTRTVSLPNSPFPKTLSINTNFKKNSYTPHSPSNLSTSSGSNGNRSRIPGNPPAFGSSSPARIPLERRLTGRVSRGEHDFARIIRRPKTAEKYGDGSELDSIDDLPTGTNRETPDPLAAAHTTNWSARQTPVPHPTPTTGQARVRTSSLKPFELQGDCVSTDIGTSPVAKLDQATSSSSPSLHKTEISKKRSFSQSATSQPYSASENKPQSDNVRTIFSSKKTGSSSQSIRHRKPASKPTLIRNLNASTTTKVVGDMVYNPTLQCWEGNEGALKAFEKRSRHKPSKTENTMGSAGSRFNRPSPSSSSLSRTVKLGNSSGSAASSPTIRRSEAPRARPALITRLGRDIGSEIPQVIGAMVFDPKKMCWLSTEAEEEDVFAELEDMDTENDAGVRKIAPRSNHQPNISSWQEPDADPHTPTQKHILPCESKQESISSTSNRRKYNPGEELLVTETLSASLESAEKVHRSKLGTFWPRGFGGLCLNSVGPNRGLGTKNIGRSISAPNKRRTDARDTIAAGRSHLYDIRMIAGGTTRK